MPNSKPDYQAEFEAIARRHLLAATPGTKEHCLAALALMFLQLDRQLSQKFQNEKMDLGSSPFPSEDSRVCGSTTERQPRREGQRA